MNTLKQSVQLLVLFAALSMLSACDKSTQSEQKTNTQDERSTVDPVINAKAVMDQVHTTVNTAVDTKMEQLESIDIADIYDNPDAYMAMNAKKSNVKTTESGLQYRVVRAGNGPKPARSNRVQVHYRGNFPDGSEFDSSYKSGKPADFAVTQVISGWTEALLMMREGSKWELVIPPNLAYGEHGFGNVIPPNQVLKFEVELLDADYSK